MTKDLKDTIDLMQSADYKDRFRAEYYQTETRVIKLMGMVAAWDNGTIQFEPTCPRSIYNLQIEYMNKYLAVLEARAAIEGIEL